MILNLNEASHLDAFSIHNLKKNYHSQQSMPYLGGD